MKLVINDHELEADIASFNHADKHFAVQINDPMTIAKCRFLPDVLNADTYNVDIEMDKITVSLTKCFCAAMHLSTDKKKPIAVLHFHQISEGTMKINVN